MAKFDMKKIKMKWWGVKIKKLFVKGYKKYQKNKNHIWNKSQIEPNDYEWNWRKKIKKIKRIKTRLDMKYKW